MGKGSLNRLAWALVALGVVLRIARYGMDYPLWWDEAFVAVNFIRRGYLELMRPLDFGQVCPILFLWLELTVVKLLGFSEWTLRLFPLICAVVSVGLFRYTASQVVRGPALLLAVAIFAVAYHPIRHAADVKPYASDLLAALALLAAALRWQRRPEQAGPLWALAALAPMAVALSYPSIFVAGAIILGLLPIVVRVRRPGVSAAFATFTVGAVATFLVVYVAVTHSQATATLEAMRAPWSAGFPPLDDGLALVRWLAVVHTGDMFAYPCGGKNGASSLTFLLFALGAKALWRRGGKQVVFVCLAPFGLALVAAAIRRYPYGGVADGSPARIMQYLVPSICLLTGVGAATTLSWLRRSRASRSALRLGLIALLVIGVAPLTAEWFHPYRAIHAQRARQFARRFWPEFARDAEPVCLRWDLGLGGWDSTNLNAAVYLCNQRIYAPNRIAGKLPRWQAISERRPLRCVASMPDPADHSISRYLDALSEKYRLRDCRTVVVDMAEPGAVQRTESYTVYEFVPRKPAAGASIASAIRSVR